MNKIKNFSFGKLDSMEEPIIFSDVLNASGRWDSITLKGDSDLVKNFCEIHDSTHTPDVYGDEFRLFLVEFENNSLCLYRSML